MLSTYERLNLMTLAMQAEAECYNEYFMQGLIKELTKYIDIHGAEVLWNFLKYASPVTYRLYLEFCLAFPSELKQNISFEV